MEFSCAAGVKPCVAKDIEEFMPDQDAEARNDAGGGTTPPTPPAAAEKPLPAAADLHVEKPAALSPRPVQRNPILAELVQGEDDLPGLVGYALYKLNKRDWLASFFKAHGREPTEGEIESYVLGERTQRRIATYRRLGEDLVRRKAADLVEKAAAATASPPPASSGLQRVSAMRANSLQSALAPAKPTGSAVQPRSAKTALIFWIAVLIVLAATGYIYVNNSSFFLR
jgi:hypothetical protein